MARPKRGAGSESAGYHFDGTPKGPPRKGRTPVVAPSKAQAARGPAGDYAGATKDFHTAVASLPSSARTVTEAATVAATKQAARRAGVSQRRVQAAAQAERRRMAAALARLSAGRERRAQRALGPKARPQRFDSKPTAGTPTARELRQAKAAGKLGENKKGFLVTPNVRQASQGLQRAARIIARSGAAADLPHLDPEGDRVAGVVLRTGRRSGESRKELLAAIETGLVESGGFHNLNYGDADSQGWRQERTSLFGSDATKPKQGALNFFTETDQQSGATAGELAANVQRPAEQYRGRYDEVKPQAVAILKAFNRGGLNAGQRQTIRQAQKAARKVGLQVKPGSGAAAGPPPPKVVKRFKAIKVLAKKIAKMDIPYVYGGGHNGGMPNPSEGLDCSSSSVYLLRKAGIDVPNITSGEFGNYFPSGPGAVTIFYNPTHVFLRIGDEYWGTSAGDSGDGGLGPHPAPSSDYLSQYSVAHVPGLGKKQALQLGISMPAGGSEAFPGMTVSPSGTTATIDPAASGGAGGVKRGKPGFSKAPIRLTRLQKINKTKRELRAAGVPLGKGKKVEPEVHPVLQELIEKYGSTNPVPTTAAEKKAAAAA